MFDLLEISGELINYRIKTCNGEKKTTGRKLQSVVVEAINREVQIILPNLLECEEIPGNKSEIPTPEVAMAFPHLESIAAKIPSIDQSAEVLILLGRDAPQVHKVREVINGPDNAPWGQRLDLGWVVIGETCLGEVHVPNTSISACRTSVKIQSNGKPSTLDPCPNKVKVDELFDSGEDTISFSREEKQFLKIMETEGKLNPDKQWTAPLPFRTPRPRLPNNREQALKRALILHKSLEKDSIKRQHFIAFMKGVLDNGHAEKAPPLKAHEERWYLPLFGVYHPKKLEKIRGVFDSSAVFQGVSLNQVLFKGPDLTNGLVGVLMRFRREGVAVCGDIESMFYCFGVVEKHRNFLRFFWYEENDLSKPLIEYRMCKHVFGNKPSPAVANYGLREIVKEADPDVVDFVNNNFYVDDGLTSCEDNATAISLMKRTQQALMTSGGVRLHKISSNSQEVLNAFEREDIAKEIRDFNVEEGGAPIQRSLGLQWRLFEDVFTFHINPEKKPFTKRGVLATINSIYDPLGFISPVLVCGRVLFRTIMHLKLDWDDPLPEGMKHKWDAWKESLKKLASLKIQRTYHKSLRKDVINTKVHVYCDASEQAVAAVAFLRTTTIHGTEVGFLIGKSRISPKQGHTIPRLELCSTVVATELAKIIITELHFPPSDIIYHSDSRVCLGYLNNTTRRFHTYVANRVEKVLLVCEPHQWNYVPTDQNPADHGTRYVDPSKLQSCAWLTGPQHLHKEEESSFPLVDPENDKEIRKEEVTTFKTVVIKPQMLSEERIKRFSTWTGLTRAITYLKHQASSFRAGEKTSQCSGWHICTQHRSIDEYRQAEIVIIKDLQRQFYDSEINCLRAGKPVHRNSSVIALSPMLNAEGLLSVGGRLHKSKLPFIEKHPTLIPGNSHVAKLLVHHYHTKIHHQGRHLTEGMIRQAGYWITSCKKLVSSVIYRCVLCRKLRRTLAVQRMGDMPEDRMSCDPAFTHVGVDCFGPWDIVARRTRGGIAKNKRWAVMFSCLSTRAIHIEVIEEMSTSSFINALRRFVSVRGKIKTLRSDQGTNFIGASNDDDLHTHLVKNQIEWKMNPPHASHGRCVGENDRDY
ncbi:uncharacterized protein [Antedon mediterranea]|uniref:uncharacterized protein n=1 Tax=Antedon mediterranea TaxID=105859 RepID=UPI003AF4AC4D